MAKNSLRYCTYFSNSCLYSDRVIEEEQEKVELLSKCSVSKSSQVLTFCDFLDFKKLYYKFEKNPEIHQNITGDRNCKRLGSPFWDEKILPTHCQDNWKI